MFFFLVLSGLGFQASSLSSSTMLVDSDGRLLTSRNGHGAAALLRREESRHVEIKMNESSIHEDAAGRGTRELVRETVAPVVSTGGAMDELFHLTNKSKCDHGAGPFLHYALHRTPLHYRHCADLCLAKQQCLGFDWDEFVCRLFTIMPVGFGSWGAVSFNVSTGGPLGNGTYAHNTSIIGDPILVTHEQAEHKQHGCYIRREFRAAESYYHKKGDGECLGANGSAKPKFYKTSDLDHDGCMDACSKQNLCVAWSFDVVNSECKLYTQKPVHHWFDAAASIHSGGADDDFVASPKELDATHETTASNISCNAKSTYVDAEELYVRDGHGLCQNWKHASSAKATEDECAEACDELASCIGFDYDGTACRLFGPGSATHPGVGIYDRIPPDPSVLTGASASVGESGGCYRKTHFRTWDSYQLVGNHRCNGGGYFNYYEYSVAGVFPLKACSSKCLERPECLGFDFGNLTCFLYTSQAVPMGSWPGVSFSDGGPFIGSKLNEEYAIGPSSHIPEGYLPHAHALNVTLTAAEIAGGAAGHAEHTHHCYAKLTPVAPDSYYENAGRGTCSHGGLYSSYKLVHGSAAYNLSDLSFEQVCALCQDSCNMRDECVGFDCGKWSNSEITYQHAGPSLSSTPITTPSCHMYPKKPVWDWPRVDAERGGEVRKPPQGTGSHAGLWAPNPDELIGEFGVLTHFEQGDLEDPPNYTYCYRKTNWIDLPEYYVKFNHQPCASYRHYIHAFNGASSEQQARDDCSEKCDMFQSCLGFDLHSDTSQCRLFTMHPINIPWAGVHAHSDGVPFDGVASETGKAASAFAMHPIQLVTYSAMPTGSGSCYLKTHAPDQKQALSSAEP